MGRLIDTDRLKEVFGRNVVGGSAYFDLIDNAPSVEAIPIPKGATNGDIIKAMFPDLEVIDNGDSVIRLYKTVEYSFDDEFVAEYSIDWWTAPYKGEQR